MAPHDENYWSCKILNGPSKWSLILALFEGKRVEFELEKISSDVSDELPDWWPTTEKIKADITKVGAALPPQSFEYWEIEGFLPDIHGNESAYINFRGEFSTETRKGQFVFFDGKLD